jgi:hypothetical protein
MAMFYEKIKLLQKNVGTILPIKNSLVIKVKTEYSNNVFTAVPGSSLPSIFLKI